MSTLRDDLHKALIGDLYGGDWWANVSRVRSLLDAGWVRLDILADDEEMVDLAAKAMEKWELGGPPTLESDIVLQAFAKAALTALDEHFKDTL